MAISNLGVRNCNSLLFELPCKFILESVLRGEEEDIRNEDDCGEKKEANGYR